MGREDVTGGVHAVSVLACGSALAGVFTHLSKNVEGRGWGSVKNDHTRGVCHIVWRWHLRRPTGPYSGQPVTPPVLPLREKGLHGFSQSHQSLCMSSSRFLTPLDSPLTELACLKALFVQFMQPEVDFLFCFCGEIFPHHTVPIPQPWVSWTKEPSVSLTLPLELKNEKLSFHWICPVQSFSLHIQRSIFPLFTVMIYIKILQDVSYCRSCTLYWLVSIQEKC